MLAMVKKKQRKREEGGESSNMKSRKNRNQREYLKLIKETINNKET